MHTLVEKGALGYETIWKDVVSEVIGNGEKVDLDPDVEKGKRSGGKTYEIEDMIVKIQEPPFPLEKDIKNCITVVGQKFIDNMLIREDTPQYNRLYGNGQIYEFGQIYELIHRMKKNIGTRRAVFTIFLPADILSDYGVCTNGGQFLVRDNTLSLRVFMRSNDAYNAFPGNVFGFVKVLHEVADELNVDIGDYIHYATSMHVYDTDFENVKKVMGTG